LVLVVVARVVDVTLLVEVVDDVTVENDANGGGGVVVCAMQTGCLIQTGSFEASAPFPWLSALELSQSVPVLSFAFAK
jgi:hypothetical protein